MIGFDYFPAYRRASMVAVEMKGKKRSLKGGYIPEYILIAGQYDQTKVGIVVNVPFKAFTSDEVGEKCGFGSELHRQAIWIFAQLGGFSENVWIVAVAEPVGGAAATGTVTFAGTATSPGTFPFSIGGDLINLNIPKGMLAADAATAFDAAIDAAISLAVKSGAAAGAVVTATAKWKGTTGNEIRIVLNPDGKAQEAANPSGLTVTLPANGLLTAGAGDPSMDGVLFDAGADNLKDRWYTIIQQPYTDATAITAMKASWALRFDPATKRFFLAPFGYVKKTYAEAFAIPATINSRGICPVWDPRSLSPNFELGAAVAGLVAASALQDPGRPFKTLPLGIPVDGTVDNLLYPANDALFRAGMGYCKVDGAGELRLGDLPTSYRKTPAGADTEEWFDAVSITRRQQKVYMVDQLFTGEPFSRGMMGSDDMVTGKDYVIKPKMLVTAMMNLVDVWASEGWTKNPEEVKASLVAEINEGNNSRADVAITDDEAQALRIIAFKYAFLY